MAETTVTLGAHTVPLRRPTSIAARRDVQIAVSKNPIRALCAALGLAWGGKPLRARYAYDPLAYGGEVLDELVGLGIPESDVYAAASRAFELMADAPTEEGTQAAEDFTVPPRGGSTP